MDGSNLPDSVWFDFFFQLGKSFPYGESIFALYTLFSVFLFKIVKMM